MHHKETNQWRQTLALIAILLWGRNQAVLADGLRNPPPTAIGIAKSNAHSTFAADASASAYNPANLALLTQPDAQLSFTVSRSEISWTPNYIESDNSWALLPNAFAAMPIGSHGLVFGLAITTPYGQSTKWNRATMAAANPLITSMYEAEMSMINISPTLAFPVSDKLLFGAGIDLAYSELNLKLNVPLPSSPLFTSSYDIIKVETDGTGVGAHAGLTWLATENQRAALTIRSPMYIKYEGDLSLQLDQIPNAAAPISTSIRFPTTLTAGYGIQLSDALQLEAQIEWLEWSLYKNMSAEYTGALGSIDSMLTDPNWKDTWTLGIGGSYQLNNAWTLHCGYAFIETPIPDSTYSPLYPDSDRHVISTGFSYKNNSHQFDFSYAYSIFKTRNIDNSANSSYYGNFKIDANLVGITYKYTF